jgi:hypothetical protein
MQRIGSTFEKAWEMGRDYLNHPEQLERFEKTLEDLSGRVRGTALSSLLVIGFFSYHAAKQLYRGCTYRYIEPRTRALHILVGTACLGAAGYELLATGIIPRPEWLKFSGR